MSTTAQTAAPTLKGAARAFVDVLQGGDLADAMRQLDAVLKADGLSSKQRREFKDWVLSGLRADSGNRDLRLGDRPA